MKKIPLTRQQYSMYLEWKLNPQSCAYNTIFQFKLYGKIKKKLLYKALQYITQKHESLRTQIVLESTEVNQIIQPESSVILKYFSIENLDVYWQDLIRSYLYKPFNLKEEAPYRYVLIKLGKNRYVFALCWHHIIVDASSVNILLRDLSCAYNRYVNRLDTKDCSEEVSLEFSLRNVAKDVYDIRLSEEYWSNKLSKQDINRIDLHDDSSELGDYRIYKELPESLTKSIMSMVGALEITPFIFLASLFVVLLHKYSQSENINLLYSTSVRNRSLREKVGFFVNNLPLSYCFGDTMSFEHFIKKVAGQLNSDRLFKDITLSEIMNFFRKEKHINLGIMFNFMISQSTSIDFSINFKDIRAKIIPFVEFEAIPNMDLSLRFDCRKRILLEFECNKKLSKNYTAKLIEAYVTLIKDAIENPQKSTCNFSVITEKEKNTLSRWNDNEYRYNTDLILHKLFEGVVKDNNDKVALVCEEKQLTYGFLNEQANKLAHFLREFNIGPEMSVGVCVYRNIELTIAMLSILKSGGVYVPIDPEHPKDRVDYILKNAGIFILLITSDLKEKFKQYSGRLICIDEKKYFLKPSDNLKVKLFADNLAYIIYTSGSTGRPKGVAISHGAIFNRVLWMIDKYFSDGIEPILLQRTIYGFDASIWEHFVPILCKGRLVVAMDKVLKDIFLINHLIKINSINVIQLVASIANILITEDCFGGSCLKKIFLGGEQLSGKLVRELYKNKAVDYIVNLYGPTEASIDVAHYICKKNNVYENIPIGQALYNTKLYVLDSCLNQVPIGNIGQIYIDGVGIARGYVNNPSMTAEKFIPNPFINKSGGGGRLYNTGDLGRYLNDGNIEFLGRIDQQVKIRGVRIELGEIESNIQSINGVKQCVVLAVDDADGQKKLVGYLVLENDARKDNVLKKCREVCKSNLPLYMQPSQIMVLRCFPMTPNGKLDKKSFPLPKDREGLSEYKKPVGYLERRLANLWKELLGLERVGATDSFFSMGGNSILLVQMLNRLKEIGYPNVTAVDLFSNHTIRLLALHLKIGHEANGVYLEKIDVDIIKRKRPILLRYKRR